MASNGLLLLFALLFLTSTTASIALVGWMVVDAARTGTKFIGCCWNCRYDLRGMQRQERCPECGHPFRVAAHGDIISGRYSG